MQPSFTDLIAMRKELDQRITNTTDKVATEIWQRNRNRVNIEIENKLHGWHERPPWYKRLFCRNS